MVDEDERSEGLGVCKVEDAASQAAGSVIWILRGPRLECIRFPYFRWE